jgi:hypothetical protein
MGNEQRVESSRACCADRLRILFTPQGFLPKGNALQVTARNASGVTEGNARGVTEGNARGALPSIACGALVTVIDG